MSFEKKLKDLRDFAIQKRRDQHNSFVESIRRGRDLDLAHLQSFQKDVNQFLHEICNPPSNLQLKPLARPALFEIPQFNSVLNVPSPNFEKDSPPSQPSPSDPKPSHIQERFDRDIETVDKIPVNGNEDDYVSEADDESLVEPGPVLEDEPYSPLETENNQARPSDPDTVIEIDDSSHPSQARKQNQQEKRKSSSLTNESVAFHTPLSSQGDDIQMNDQYQQEEGDENEGDVPMERPNRCGKLSFRDDDEDSEEIENTPSGKDQAQSEDSARRVSEAPEATPVPDVEVQHLSDDEEEQHSDVVAETPTPGHVPPQKARDQEQAVNRETDVDERVSRPLFSTVDVKEIPAKESSPVRSEDLPIAADSNDESFGPDYMISIEELIALKKDSRISLKSFSVPEESLHRHQKLCDSVKREIERNLERGQIDQVDDESSDDESADPDVSLKQLEEGRFVYEAGETSIFEDERDTEISEEEQKNDDALSSELVNVDSDEMMHVDEENPEELSDINEEEHGAVEVSGSEDDLGKEPLKTDNLVGKDHEPVNNQSVVSHKKGTVPYYSDSDSSDEGTPTIKRSVPKNSKKKEKSGRRRSSRRLSSRGSPSSETTPISQEDDLTLCKIGDLVTPPTEKANGRDFKSSNSQTKEDEGIGNNQSEDEKQIEKENVQSKSPYVNSKPVCMQQSDQVKARSSELVQSYQKFNEDSDYSSDEENSEIVPSKSNSSKSKSILRPINQNVENQLKSKDSTDSVGAIDAVTTSRKSYQSSTPPKFNRKKSVSFMVEDEVSNSPQLESAENIEVTPSTSKEPKARKNISDKNFNPFKVRSDGKLDFAAIERLMLVGSSSTQIKTPATTKPVGLSRDSNLPRQFDNDLQNINQPNRKIPRFHNTASKVFSSNRVSFLSQTPGARPPLPPSARRPNNFSKSPQATIPSPSNRIFTDANSRFTSSKHTTQDGIPHKESTKTKPIATKNSISEDSESDDDSDEALTPPPVSSNMPSKLANKKQRLSNESDEEISIRPNRLPATEEFKKELMQSRGLQSQKPLQTDNQSRRPMMLLDSARPKSEARRLIESVRATRMKREAENVLDASQDETQKNSLTNNPKVSNIPANSARNGVADEDSSSDEENDNDNVESVLAPEEKPKALDDKNDENSMFGRWSKAVSSNLMTTSSTEPKETVNEADEAPKSENDSRNEEGNGGGFMNIVSNIKSFLPTSLPGFGGAEGAEVGSDEEDTEALMKRRKEDADRREAEIVARREAVRQQKQRELEEKQKRAEMKRRKLEKAERAKQEEQRRRELRRIEKKKEEEEEKRRKKIEEDRKKEIRRKNVLNLKRKMEQEKETELKRLRKEKFGQQTGPPNFHKGTKSHHHGAAGSSSVHGQDISPTNGRDVEMDVNMRTPVASARKMRRMDSMGPSNYQMTPANETILEGSDEEEERRRGKLVPKWAETDKLMKSLHEQKDPDDLFSASSGCNLSEVFGQQRKYRTRSSSGNWLSDRLTAQEEMTYKKVTRGFDD